MASKTPQSNEVHQEPAISVECLADALYTVRRRCPFLPVLAVQWMHPKHPVHPVQQKILHKVRTWAGKAPQRNFIRRCLIYIQGIGESAWRIVRCIFYAVCMSLMIIWLRCIIWRQMRELTNRRFSIILKTWIFGPARQQEDIDFYYGDLQHRLLKQGVTCLLLCGDGSGSKDWFSFAKAHISNSGLSRLPEKCLIDPIAPLKMAILQIVTSFKLQRLKSEVSDPLIKQICSFASLDCLSPGTTLSGLFFWIGRKAVQIWRPKAFVTLYEGHGWEKCLWWGAKTVDSSCRTVGYQHTVLFPHSISLLKPHVYDGEHSTPDVVLCLGERTKSMMQQGHIPRQSRLITFGSFRRDGSDQMFVMPRPARRIVLVLPEGILDEAKLLFDWAMRVSQSLPDHRFVFRCHPVLPFAQVWHCLDGVPERCSNIEISDRDSIADDFARSSVMLYRGSSAALYGVLYGLKPIYLQIDECNDSDVLFELKEWRERARSVLETEQILRRYAATTENDACGEWQSAAAYVKSYTMPVDDSSLDRFLAEVNLPNTDYLQSELDNTEN